MADRKKVTYKEPASYFNADMRRAAEKWDREHKKNSNAKSEKKPDSKKK